MRKFFKRLYWNFYLKRRLWEEIQRVASSCLKYYDKPGYAQSYWKNKLNELLVLWDYCIGEIA